MAEQEVNKPHAVNVVGGSIPSKSSDKDKKKGVKMIGKVTLTL